MINVGDKVKLNGTITAAVAGSIDIEIKDFFIDGEWKSLTTPISQSISSTEYTSTFTSAELAQIKKWADKDSKLTTICDDDMALIKSIASKLKDTK